MEPLALHKLHQRLGAHFAQVNAAEVADNYGDASAEHAALRQSAGLLDLSFRSRLCLTGADRVRFLHGQVTNDIKNLGAGQGCYAALVNAKGKMQSDLAIYCLLDELLLDFEPGLAGAVAQRLEHCIVADDVQVVDVSSPYGLLSVQGPQADAVLAGSGVAQELPPHPFGWRRLADEIAGEAYLVNRPRTGSSGFDLFLPGAALEPMAERLLAATQGLGGRACGWQALEWARIEAGIPRFGLDLDETTLPQESGLEDRAVSYTKGCYIGQEVLNRIHTLGHVNRALRGLQLAEKTKLPPAKGDKLFHDGKEVGYITSAVVSPSLHAVIALGYVRKEANAVGTELRVRTAAGETAATVVPLPFGQPPSGAAPQARSADL